MFWGQLELKSYTDSINSKFSTRRIKKNQKKFNPPPQVCPVLFLVWVPAVSDWQPECWLCVVESLAHSGLLQQLLYSPQVTTEPKTVQVQDRRAQPEQGWGCAGWQDSSDPTRPCSYLCSTGGRRTLISNQTATGGNSLCSPNQGNKAHSEVKFPGVCCSFVNTGAGAGENSFVSWKGHLKDAFKPSSEFCGVCRDHLSRGRTALADVTGLRWETLFWGTRPH